MEPGSNLDRRATTRSSIPITMPNFKALDYGPTEFDHRNVIASSYVYTEPKVMNDAPAALRYLVNGYETTGLVQYRTGDPLTIISSAANNSGSHQNRDRAVYSGSSAYGGSACATTRELQKLPESGTPFPSTLPAPSGTFKRVLSGARATPIGMPASRASSHSPSGRLCKFRAEYFNLLNHTNLGDPGTGIGRVVWQNHQHQLLRTWPSDAPQNDPRIAQFSLKLLF